MEDTIFRGGPVLLNLALGEERRALRFEKVPELGKHGRKAPKRLRVVSEACQGG